MNPPADDVCPYCGYPETNHSGLCPGTGKVPSIEAAPPLASVDAAPAPPKLQDGATCPEWQEGVPPIKAGAEGSFLVAFRGSGGAKIHVRQLDYRNRFLADTADGCEPDDDQEANDDGDYYWTGWFESSCEQCDTFWRFNGEVLAWIPLPEYGTGTGTTPAPSPVKPAAPDAGPTPRMERIKLAQFANSGPAFNSLNCTCDPSVGMAPCEYCAIYQGLQDGLTAETELAVALAQLAQMSKDYYDVADAVCKESLSPADASQQARALRTELASARDELAKEQSYANDLIMDVAAELEKAAENYREISVGAMESRNAMSKERDALRAAAQAQAEELRAKDATIAALREALEEEKSAAQCTVEQYEKNGPTWTSRSSGEEYFSASYVIGGANEIIERITKALAATAPRKETP